MSNPPLNKVHFKILFVLLALIIVSCGFPKDNNPSEKISYKYLALGDSYTVGESVCDSCSFPKQLTNELNEVMDEKTWVKIIAKTGWTTTDLLSAIASENPSKDYDLASLLIGVNNQYQGQPFSLYEEEFPILLDKTIEFANGKPENVIVLSIPDYAFTPYGQTSGKALKITSELKEYNAYVEKIALKKGVHFANITAITEEGLRNRNLVAADGLHPSKIAYKRFIETIFEIALNILR